MSASERAKTRRRFVFRRRRRRRRREAQKATASSQLALQTPRLASIASHAHNNTHPLLFPPPHQSTNPRPDARAPLSGKRSRLFFDVSKNAPLPSSSFSPPCFPRTSQQAVARPRPLATKEARRKSFRAEDRHTFPPPCSSSSSRATRNQPTAARPIAPPHIGPLDQLSAWAPPKPDRQGGRDCFCRASARRANERRVALVRRSGFWGAACSRTNGSPLPPSQQ